MVLAEDSRCLDNALNYVSISNTVLEGSRVY